MTGSVNVQTLVHIIIIALHVLVQEMLTMATWSPELASLRPTGPFMKDFHQV